MAAPLVGLAAKLAALKKVAGPAAAATGAALVGTEVGKARTKKYIDEPRMRKEQEEREAAEREADEKKMKKGGAVKYKAGGYVKAADGIAKKGKTKGKMV